MNTCRTRYKNRISCTRRFLFIASIGIIYSLVFTTSSFALDSPESQLQIAPYIAPQTPVISSTANYAKPIAVGDAAEEGESMNLQIRTDTFTRPMNAYLAFSAPVIAGNTLLVFDSHSNIDAIENGLSPWKTGITELDEQPLGIIPLDLLPGDDFTFYLLLIEPDSGNYYLWTAIMPLKPTIQQFGEAVIQKFPTEVDGPMAILLSYEMGYSLQQIVNSVMKGIITSDGILTDTSGRQIVPENDSLGLINHSPSKSYDIRQNDIYFTKEQLEDVIKRLEKRLIERRLTNKESLAALITFFIDQLMVSWDDEQLIAPDDRLYYLFRSYAIIQETRIPEQAVDRTAFLQNSKNFIQLYDGPPDDLNSNPVPGNSTTHDTFRNRTPVALDSSLIAISDRTTSVILNAEDPDAADTLVYEVIQKPANGKLSGSGSFLEYRSNKGFTGTDSLTFRVSDGKTNSLEATVEIDVKPGALILDQVILSKYNGATGDLCDDSTAESTEICGEYYRLASGSEITDTYMLNDNTAVYNYQEIYVGLENIYHDVRTDFQISFSFDSPPSTITPGEQITFLRIEGIAQGFSLGKWLERSFAYYTGNSNSSGASFYNETAVSLFNRNLPINEEKWKI